MLCVTAYGAQKYSDEIISMITKAGRLGNYGKIAQEVQTDEREIAERWSIVHKKYLCCRIVDGDTDLISGGFAVKTKERFDKSQSRT